MELAGKQALVTGSAHRVGRAIALRLAQEGCHIALHYHASAEKARQTLAEIEATGVNTLAYQADLSDYADIHSLFEALDRDVDRLDILVNSAAIMQRVAFQEASLEDWNTTINLNLRAPFFCTQLAAKMMGEEGGAIINISDIAGLQPWVDFPVHSISKNGVEMLTRLTALALAPRVRVNAIAPGPVLKPTKMSDARWQALGAELPLGRSGTPTDVSEAVVFLLKNSFITGETIVVDGGNHLI